MDVQQLSSKSWGTRSISLHVGFPEGQDVGVIYLTRNNRWVAIQPAFPLLAWMDTSVCSHPQLLHPYLLPPLSQALGIASNSIQTDFQIPAIDGEQICKCALG